MGQRVPARQGRGRRGARVGAGEVGLRARAAVPRAVGGAADGARHRLSHVRPRRAAGRLRVPRRAARLRRRGGVRRQRGVPRGRAAGGADRRDHARAARRVHHRRHHGARRPARRLQLGPEHGRDAAARHAERDRRRPARQPPGLAAAARPLRGTAGRRHRRSPGRPAGRHRARHAGGPRGAGGGAVGRAHARARPGHLRRLGRPAPGARERAPEPAPRGGRPGRRLARPRAAARAPRAGGGRHAQHGGDDRARLVERRLGPRLPRDVDRPRRACGRRGQRGRRRGHHAGARGPRVRRARVVPRRRAAPRRGRCRERCIVNLRNILEAMDAVAEAQPVRVEARPAAALGGRRKSIA